MCSLFRRDRSRDRSDRRGGSRERERGRDRGSGREERGSRRESRWGAKEEDSDRDRGQSREYSQPYPAHSWSLSFSSYYSFAVLRFYSVFQSGSRLSHPHPEMEFLDISLTKDLSLLLHAIHSHSTGGFLKTLLWF
jgi:hypothetical protein